MNARILTILNAVGCLALVALIVSQWGRERSLGHSLVSTRHQLDTALDQVAKESARCAALERDITVLKESIESTQKAAEATTRDLADQSTRAAGLQSELNAVRSQVSAWEGAVQSRDTRIRELGEELSATRKRLDEAVTRLKQAAARDN